MLNGIVIIFFSNYYIPATSIFSNKNYSKYKHIEILIKNTISYLPLTVFFNFNTLHSVKMQFILNTNKIEIYQGGTIWIH
ncbi:MAG: hypothetical protein A2041_12955 [Bacteroidetes bacterium GWA2_31_9b]|nr:MAG: hypothetical protein A2041_12955 [Bacteroidetes bacterium GWA2_31_9b]